MLRSTLSAIRQLMMARKPPIVPPTQPLIIIFGATGTGKSQLAVDLAGRFNGEVINGDAMQLYAGLPIVTNKITLQEQAGVPHHLLGCIPLEHETWRVGIWHREALRIMREIRGRGKLPIVVGGTHYYLQSLLGGDPKLVDNQAARDEGLGGMEEEVIAENKDLTYEEIERRWPILKESGERMLEELRKVDPVMADRWHPKDKRKIQRSLQIWLTTGKKASDIYAEQKDRLKSENPTVYGSMSMEQEPKPEGPSSTLLFWVHAEDQILKSRLNTRVDKMLQVGLLDEVKSLDAFLHSQEVGGKIIDRTRGIWVSIGWKEFEPYLTAIKSGNATEPEIATALRESIERTQAATRRYAKRQVRWIQYQMLPAATEMGHSLFLLDSSDLLRFSETVSNRAIEISTAWLEGRPLPEPTEMSDLARACLVKEKVDFLVRRTCEVCGVLTMTDVQWRTHLKSRKHRGTLKKRAKNGGYEEFLRTKEKGDMQDEPLTPP